MAEQEETPLTASPAHGPAQVGPAAAPLHQRKSCGTRVLTSILKWAAIIVSIGAVGYFVLGAVTPVATQGSIGVGGGVGNGSSNTHTNTHYYLDGGGRSDTHAAALMQGATSQLRDAVDEMEAKEAEKAKTKEEAKAKEEEKVKEEAKAKEEEKVKEEEKAKTKEEEKVKAQAKEEKTKQKEKQYDAELDRQLSGELLVLSNQLRENDPNDTWYVR